MSLKHASLALLLSLLLALLASPTHSQSYQCSTDDDCSLNGLCNLTTQHCTCDPAWTGPDCGILDLAPAARQSGYDRTGQGVSSWGGKPVHDPASGKWLLFAAEFTGGCGLDYWSPMSRVIRAVSAGGPAGPYSFDREVVGTFAHNPTVVWSEADRLWLLFHIGCKYAQPSKCQYGGITCDDANNENGESSISMWYSKDLSDWMPQGVVLGPNKNNTWDMDTTNPSPFPLWSPTHNTTELLLAYRGCPYNCNGAEQLNLAHAANRTAPYTRLASSPLFTNGNEDPFLWRDARGHYHLLMHSLEAGGGFGDGPRVGRHAYARVWWGEWTFGNRTLAFNTSVAWVDGGVTEYYRRERPQLVFSEDGAMTPLYLTNGVQEKGSGMSYTLIQPLSTAAEWERRNGYGQDSEQQPREQPQHRHARHE